MLWYLDRQALSLIGLRYVPWLAGLNLVWETAHLPLYTIWTEATPAYMAFAVVHCTAGDVLIGSAALALVLILGREGELARWRWERIVALTALGGLAYTVWSEWLNTVALGNWAYSELMPTVNVSGTDIGGSPLAQWIFLPPLALFLARTTRRR